MDATADPIWYVFNESELCSPEQPEYLLVKTLDTPSIKYVPERTCKDMSKRSSQFHCSKCGCRLFLAEETGRPSLLADGYRADVPKYCPNCGARVDRVVSE